MIYGESRSIHRHCERIKNQIEDFDALKDGLAFSPFEVAEYQRISMHLEVIEDALDSLITNTPRINSPRMTTKGEQE